MLRQLQGWLTSYDRVFLIPGKNGTAGDFALPLLRAGAEKSEGRRILILSAAPIAVGGGFTYRRIEEQAQNQLLKLYCMYEFADNFSVIAETDTYGGLFHLVETGVLDMEEAAEALFAYR